MLVALFDFCLFLLFVAFFLYGLHQWDRLLVDREEEGHPVPGEPGEASSLGPPGRRLTLWVLIVGLGVVSLLTDVWEWLA